MSFVSVFSPIGVRQIVEEELSVDSSTTSSTFVTLITGNITTAEAKLLVWAEFSMGHSNNNADSVYRLLFDSQDTDTHRDLDMTRKACAYGSTITARGDVTEGAHTVELQWLTPAGTVICDAGTNARHHARILRVSAIEPN